MGPLLSLMNPVKRFSFQRTDDFFWAPGGPGRRGCRFGRARSSSEVIKTAQDH